MRSCCVCVRRVRWSDSLLCPWRQLLRRRTDSHWSSEGHLIVTSQNGATNRRAFSFPDKERLAGRFLKRSTIFDASALLPVVGLTLLPLPPSSLVSKNSLLGSSWGHITSESSEDRGETSKSVSLTEFSWKSFCSTVNHRPFPGFSFTNWKKIKTCCENIPPSDPIVVLQSE